MDLLNKYTHEPPPIESYAIIDVYIIAKCGYFYTHSPLPLNMKRDGHVIDNGFKCCAGVNSQYIIIHIIYAVNFALF